MLELCVDNLIPEFFGPALGPVLHDLVGEEAEDTKRSNILCNGDMMCSTTLSKSLQARLV
jgi:hypothetical protein